MIHVIDLESMPSRYTYYWKTHVPKMLVDAGMDVKVIEGTISSKASKGAFINFASTNVYKSEQSLDLMTSLKEGYVKDGDVILFTDAWNPTILMARYVIDLLKLDVKIGSLWHAGSYDRHDIISGAVSHDWSYNAERAYFYASDFNFFATKYHVDLFTSVLGVTPDHQSIHRVGFPFEYIDDIRNTFEPVKKENIIVFPHRLSPEKNPGLFDELSAAMPDYEFIKCQSIDMSKHEYYSLLNKSKIVFSANKQETLGIGVYEGVMFGNIPIVPDTLSYVEMYDKRFRYDCEGATVETLREFIETRISENELHEVDNISKEYFSCSNLIEVLRS